MSTLKSFLIILTVFAVTTFGVLKTAPVHAENLTLVEDPAPVVINGNPSCSTLNGLDEDFPLITSNFGFKLNNYPENGQYFFTSGMTGGAPTDPLAYVNFERVALPLGSGFNWDSNREIFAVIVKGGPVANVYYFDPSAFSGENHHPAINPTNSNYYGVSHIEFCFGEGAPPLGPLTAHKTAEATYERTVEWKLEKSVDPTSHEGVGGADAGDSDWTVKATKNEVEDDFLVTGTITIYNINPVPVSVNVSDTLDDETLMNVDCDPGTEGDQNQNMAVPAGTAESPGTLACTYRGEPAGRSAKLNTADIESLTDGVAGAQASAGVDWDETLTGDDEVTLGDERFTHSELISSNTEEVFPETFPCPSDPTEYTNGVHERTETNRATLTGDNTDLFAEAEVAIRCTLAALDVEKTAAGTFDRTIRWTLTKDVNGKDSESFSGGPGATFPVNWNVVADKTESLGNFTVTGSITIDNPSGISQSFTVSDVLSDGTAATVNCGGATSVPADGQVVCTYTASPTNANATLNTATVSAPGNVDQLDTDAVEWTEDDLYGYPSGTLSDARFAYSELISDDKAKTFPETFSCSTNYLDYVNGTYQQLVVNTAILNGNINLTDSASVTVTCTLQYQGETATGRGPGWPGSNWFMYTPCAIGTTIDLVAGQDYDAGDITITGTCENTRTGTNTITITLHSGFRLADVSNNVKIHPMSSEPDKYIQPGKYSIKRSFSQGTTTIVVDVPKALYYGIHLDVQRAILP